MSARAAARAGARAVLGRRGSRGLEGSSALASLPARQATLLGGGSLASRARGRAVFSALRPLLGGGLLASRARGLELLSALRSLLGGGSLASRARGLELFAALPSAFTSREDDARRGVAHGPGVSSCADAPFSSLGGLLA